MSTNWNDAATIYINRHMKPTEPSAPVAEPKPEISDDEISTAARALEEFMQSSDGLAARHLLRASGRHIIFGEDATGFGMGLVYFFDPNGIRESFEPMGTWMAYSSSVPRPRVTTVTAETAVKAAVQYEGRKPSEIMGWLRSELDRIAAAAPRK